MKKLILALALLTIFSLNIGGGALWIASDWGYGNITNGTMGDNIKEYTKYAPAIAIGDANNDGQNETVVGYSNMTNELRMYKNVSGGWSETNISDLPSTISALAIADFDKDGKNGIAIGMRSLFGQNITSSLRYYEYTNISYSQNLLPNPNFTDNLTSWDTAGATWVNDTSVNPDGNGIANLTGNYLMTNPYGMGDINAGERFYWSFLFKTDNASDLLQANIDGAVDIGINTTHVCAWINRADCSVGFPSTNYIEANTSITVQGGGWYKFETIFFATGPGGIIDCYIEAYAPTSVQVDNVIVQNISDGWTETNITVIDNNVTIMVSGDVNNNGIRDITVGYDQYTYNNTRFYENKSGGWAEQNISNNYGYDVVAMDVGYTRTDKKNKTVIGLSGAVNAIRKYENMTGKWVEKNISGTGIFNGSTPCNPGAIKIGDPNNDGANDLVFSEVHSALGIYYSSIYKFYNPSADVWLGALIQGGLTGPVPVIEIGKVNGNTNNSVYFSVNGLDLRRLDLISNSWFMVMIAGGELIDHNALRIADGDNNGENEIYASSTTLGAPYNVYRIFEYHYVPTAGGGGVGTDMFCVNVGRNKKFCSGNGNDYLCIKNNCVVVS